MPSESAFISAVQVGLGARGADWALAVLPGTPALRVLARVDPDPGRRASFAEATGLAADHAKLGDALAEADAEAVLITGRTSTAETARAALLAGKHVLLERPFALDVDDAADLVRLAHSRDRVLAVSQSHRYESAASQVRHLLAQQVVGQTRHVAVRFRRRTAAPGVLWETAVHHFDLLRAFFGEVGSVVAHHWPRDSESLSATLLFASGVTCHYTASGTSTARPTPWTGEWTVEGTDGVLEWAGTEPEEGAYARLVRASGVGEELPVGVPQVRSRRAVVDQFVRAVWWGADTEISGRYCLGTVALVAAVEASLAHGESVRVVGPSSLSLR